MFYGNRTRRPLGSARHLLPISVHGEPADTDTGTTVTPADVPSPDFSSLSGAYAPTVDALSKYEPDMPREVSSPRDYLDRPATQAALEKLYSVAQNSFNPYSKDQAEHLIALGQTGDTAMSSTAAAGDVRKLVTAIPDDAMAIVHTHPSTATPVPSPKDYQTATQTGKPNFVISKGAIYVAMPGTDPNTKNHVKVADVTTGKHGKLNINWSPSSPAERG